MIANCQKEKEWPFAPKDWPRPFITCKLPCGAESTEEEVGIGLVGIAMIALIASAKEEYTSNLTTVPATRRTR